MYNKSIESGLNYEQAKLILGLIDHESAGTWNEKIVGDHGCSHGIAQWNKCAGRIAPKTFEEQADKVVEELSGRMKQESDLMAITHHNCPACNTQLPYTKKVIKSSKLFK